jgi:cell division protein FtsB
MIRSSVMARQDFVWRPKINPAPCSRQNVQSNRSFLGTLGSKAGSKILSRNGAKRKTNTKTQNNNGFINIKLMAGALLIMAGILYIYSINSAAVKGYQMRQIENQISDLQKQNDKLKIQEAELKSLYHVEEATKDLNMAQTTNVSYVEQTSPFALK